MKHNMGFEKTGKCFVCGEDTRLLIHKECGEKMDKLKKRKAKAKKYSKDYVNHLAGIDT
jgi:hypothetical protein